MCDHIKLDERLDEFLSERHFEEWIPVSQIDSLEMSLRTFAHELAFALEQASDEENPLEKAAGAVDAIDEIISGRMKNTAPRVFRVLADETKALLWSEISLLDELMPQDRQVSPDWLEKNLYPECRGIELWYDCRNENRKSSRHML